MFSRIQVCMHESTHVLTYACTQTHSLLVASRPCGLNMQTKLQENPETPPEMNVSSQVYFSSAAKVIYVCLRVLLTVSYYCFMVDLSCKNEEKLIAGFPANPHVSEQ